MMTDLDQAGERIWAIARAIHSKRSGPIHPWPPLNASYCTAIIEEAKAVDAALRGVTPSAVPEPVQEPTDERRERLLSDLAAEGAARCCYAPGCMSAEAWIAGRCDCKHVNPIVRPHGEETGCCEMRAAYRVLAESALAAVRPSPPRVGGA